MAGYDDSEPYYVNTHVAEFIIKTIQIARFDDSEPSYVNPDVATLI